MSLRFFTFAAVAVMACSATFAQVEPVAMPAPLAQGPAADVYHSGWGALKQDGSLEGRVVTLAADGSTKVQADATVTIKQGDTVVGIATTNQDGVFSLPGLTAGVYEIVAESGSAFAAVAFEAVTGTDGAMMDVYAASMNRSSVEAVVEELWAPATAVPAFMELEGPAMPAKQSPKVMMIGGVIYGQLTFQAGSFDPAGHVVKVYRGGKLIATEPVDSMGQFAFAPGATGPVDVVVGGSAFSALGIDIVDGAGEVARVASQTGKLVSAPAPVVASQRLMIPVAGSPQGPAPQQLAEQPVQEFAPMGAGGNFFGPTPAGGFGGGVGGGGAGGGGFGGIGGAGGLLGVAGLAVGVAALADDDDGFRPPVATVVAP